MVFRFIHNAIFVFHLVSSNRFSFRFAQHRVIKQMQKSITQKHHVGAINAWRPMCDGSPSFHSHSAYCIPQKARLSHFVFFLFQHGRRVILSCEKSSTSFSPHFGASLHLFYHLHIVSFSHIIQINSKDPIPALRSRLHFMRCHQSINVSRHRPI